MKSQNGEDLWALRAHVMKGGGQASFHVNLLVYLGVALARDHQLSLGLDAVH